MNFVSDLKSRVGAIAGGIIGAFLLVGIAIVLILIIGGSGPNLPYFGLGHAIGKWTQSWTIEGIYIVFVISGMVGFVLGAIVGWRNSQLAQKWFGLMVSLGIPVIVCAWLLYSYAEHVEIPRSLKLADCSKVTQIQLTAPKGRNYRLMLTVPPGSTNSFSGHINVSVGESTITNFPIAFGQPEQVCNFFNARSNYNLEIVFDQSPPPLTSIWLNWLQTYKDRDK